MTLTKISIVPLQENEIDAVAGGPLFLPLLIAAGKGALAGATAAGLIYAAGDLLDVWGQD